MATKLTLEIDETLLKKAEEWARARGTTLSVAVSDFFAQLPRDPTEPVLSPGLRRLIGIAAPPEGRTPTYEELREEYIDYLDAKYR
jgi:hypothetical protein